MTYTIMIPYEPADSSDLANYANGLLGQPVPAEFDGWGFADWTITNILNFIFSTIDNYVFIFVEITAP